MRLSSIVDLLKVGGTAISPARSSAPNVDDAGIVVRPINRRGFLDGLLPRPLMANETYNTPAQDTSLDGTQFIFAEVTISQNLATSGLKIQTSNDAVTWFTQTQINAIPTTVTICFGINKRYWRIQLINGATAQTSNSLSVNTWNTPPILMGTDSAASGSPNKMFPWSGTTTGSGTGSQTTWTPGLSSGARPAEGGDPLALFDNASGGFTHPLATCMYVSRGNIANGDACESLRTPRFFKTVSTAAAGNTAIWTPTTGKKFRLMRYQIEVQEGSTLGVGGNEAITFQDNVTTIGFAHDVFIPAIALATNGILYQSNWIDLGNGILSATANNVLNINLGTAITAGAVRVNVCGTEE